MKKMLFILNPCAGMRRANRYLPDMISSFNRAGYRVTVHVTDGQADATRITEALAREMDMVVCCGGDGTFNEVITGLMRSGADVPLGYIPAGSTNDFASSMKLPLRIPEAARLVTEGTPGSFDIGRFNDRYFSYVASFGAFTRASYSTPQSIKNALGHTAYVLAGIRDISQLRKIHARLELDDAVIEDDFLFGAISNSTSVGGILTLDPKQVDMADGKFEVLLVRSPKNLSEISECLKAVRTQKYNCNMITFRPTTRVRVTTEENVTWTLDGERADCRGTVEVKNIHHAIRLVTKG